MAEITKLGPVRCNFPVLSTPKGSQDKPDDLKYSVTILLDKKKDKEAHAKIVNTVKTAVNGCASWTDAKKKKIINELLVHVNGEMLNKFAIIKDGDALNNALLDEGKTPRPEQTGKWVVTLRNRRAPQVVAQDGSELLGAMIDSTIRSGYWINVAFSAYTWNKPESQGAAMQLQGVQMVRKDSEFGKVDCAFDAVEVEEETGEGFQSDDED